MNAHSGTLTDVTPMHPAGTLVVVIPATAMLVIRAVDSLAQVNTYAEIWSFVDYQLLIFI